MGTEYFEEIANRLKKAHPGLASCHHLAFKNVFGAAGGYVNGRIFVTCGKFGVALKLPPKALEELFKEKGVGRLRYFPNGHIKKEYAVLPKRILENKRRFQQLIDTSIQSVLSGRHPLV